MTKTDRAEPDRAGAGQAGGSQAGGSQAGGSDVTAWELATSFSRVALESFGGGLGAWMLRLIVAEKRWLSEAEYLSAATLCQVLPGANQINMAVFVGARLRGALGAVAAVAGLVVLPAIVAVLAGAALFKLRDDALARHILSGRSSASAGLAVATALRQGSKVLVSAVPVTLAAATLLLVFVVRAPLWLTLPLCGLPGITWAWRRLRGAPA